MSRSIDAAGSGRRIRTARVAAGMTQAQVAAEDVSAAYLSRIEDGQRRPEAGLLERMAGRMGVSLEDLLLTVPRDRVQELRLAVDYAESLAGLRRRRRRAQGDRQGPRRRGDRQRAPGAAGGPGWCGPAPSRSPATWTRRSCCSRRLTAQPSPDANWLKALIALSRCYRDSGEHARAIAVGEEAQTIIDESGHRWPRRGDPDHCHDGRRLHLPGRHGPGHAHVHARARGRREVRLRHRQGLRLLEREHRRVDARRPPVGLRVGPEGPSPVRAE
ncbi:helix-turn-helix transcriptional regulator [Nocardioides sp. W3-2-3]|uniref:helix-turn-helix domain-containing protein n=1 Tax=Nocardioides convexus TaxID=2712224 RepID=UPI002418455F|nr:helix-turn-helix transcriptional regulator [Nocardioides convexus]NHA00595.1 helix-turn-helix transcriptional regulator [Nocardioides convexus]